MVRISRLNAHIAAGRMSDAKEVHSVAERLVKHSLEKSERSLVDASSQLERHAHVARLKNPRAQKSLLDALQHRYFSE